MTLMTQTSASSSTQSLLAAGTEMVHYSEPSWLGAILTGLFAVAGAIFILVSARAMYLAPDALSQINMLGPGVGVGIPLLICANLIYSWDTQGFQIPVLLRAIVAITGMLVIQAVGSYIMGRAVHATHWDHTVPLSGGKRAREPK